MSATLSHLVGMDHARLAGVADKLASELTFARIFICEAVASGVLNADECDPMIASMDAAIDAAIGRRA